MSETIERWLVETIVLIWIHNSTESLVLRSSGGVGLFLSVAADTIGLLLLRLIPLLLSVVEVRIASRSYSDSSSVILALNTIRLLLVDIRLLGEVIVGLLVEIVVVHLSLHNSSATIVLTLDTTLLVAGLLLEVVVGLVGLLIGFAGRAAGSWLASS